MNEIINLLTQRRSVTAKDMCLPGPSDSELEQILQCGHRVPDHGKLGPWRFIIFQNQARETAGNILKQRFIELNPEANSAQIDFEQGRFLRAPLVIAVVSCPTPHHKLLIWEQELCMGAVCQNLLVATHALGYVGQWLTEWYAFDDSINRDLGLNKEERFAGFIYIGSSNCKPKERNRPNLHERVTFWSQK